MDWKERIERQSMFVELGLYFGEIRRFTAKYGRNHMNSTQSEFYRKLRSLQELRNSPGYREALSKIDTAGLKRYRNMIRDLFSLLNGNVIFNVCSADVTIQENDTQENSEERGNFYEEYTQRQIELQAGRRNYVWDIYAIKSGKVIRSYYSADYGNNILIEDNDGVTVRYAHLVGLKLDSGTVSEGQVIGEMGNTGTTDKHLHVSVYPAGTSASYWGNDAKINPVDYIREGTYPANTYISAPFHAKGNAWASGEHEGTDFSGNNGNVIPNWSHGITGVAGIMANNNRN